MHEHSNERQAQIRSDEHPGTPVHRGNRPAISNRRFSTNCVVSFLKTLSTPAPKSVPVFTGIAKLLRTYETMVTLQIPKR